MSVDTLERFILLPDLKFNNSYPLGNWGIGLEVEKISEFEVCPKCATSHYATLKEVGKQFRCSARLVYTAFYQQLEHWAKARAHPLPKKIGLDEHSIRKPKYKATEFATIVVDHVGKRVFDLIDGKDLDSLRAGFACTLGKDKVEIVTLDMCETFRSFVRATFPNAMIVVDRFHVMRLFNRKVNKYRKKITGDDRKNPINKLLLRRTENVSFFERCQIVKWLNQHPKLRELWEVKEAMARFYRTKGYGLSSQDSGS